MSLLVELLLPLSRPLPLRIPLDLGCRGRGSDPETSSSFTAPLLSRSLARSLVHSLLWPDICWERACDRRPWGVHPGSYTTPHAPVPDPPPSVKDHPSTHPVCVLVGTKAVPVLCSHPNPFTTSRLRLPEPLPPLRRLGSAHPGIQAARESGYSGAKGREKRDNVGPVRGLLLGLVPHSPALRLSRSRNLVISTSSSFSRSQTCRPSHLSSA